MRITLLSIGLAVLLGAGTAIAQETPAASKHGKSSKSAHGSGPAKAASAKGGKGPSDEQIAEQLKAFCVKWMGFLETRERDNQKSIKWDKHDGGVSGHYVGYSKEYDCNMKERSSNGTPVATIVYKEFVYEKIGGSQAEAEQAAPNVVDATEVTEIFRYSKGEWVY
jgi:hypothetical protein